MTRAAVAEQSGVELSKALLDAPEAARYLHCTPRGVRELWARRELPAVRVGRLVRFLKSDLDAYVAARRVPAVRGPLAER